MVKDGIDGTSVEGAANVAYAIPNISVELTTTQPACRCCGGGWSAARTRHSRSRRSSTKRRTPRARTRSCSAAICSSTNRACGRVLELAAEKAGWDPAKPLPKGRGRGIAVAEAFKTFVAQVAEVSVDKDGNVKVDRVVCAVDCGTPINPDIIAAQMEGGIGFGLGAALHSAITLKDGRVEQNNFDAYKVLRIAEMPKVDVHIVQSGEAPTGVGEPGVAPVGPAVANAIFAATGKRLHSLPFPAAAEKSA